MCIQNLVKFCPLVLKILGGNKNYDGMTELQKDRQGKSSIAPTFSKRGYKNSVQNKIGSYKLCVPDIIFHCYYQICFKARFSSSEGGAFQISRPSLIIVW